MVQISKRPKHVFGRDLRQRFMEESLLEKRLERLGGSAHLDEPMHTRASADSSSHITTDPPHPHAPPPASCTTLEYALSLGAVACVVAAAAFTLLYTSPPVVHCDPLGAAPLRFKVDVSDFWRPKLSASVQLALTLTNADWLRPAVLDECKVVVYEEATNLRLGAATHGPIHVGARSKVAVSLALKGFGASLPRDEQRRLSELFLRHKALILTLVATATSQLPRVKGAKPATSSPVVRTSSAKKLDLAAAFKDPFFQRPAKEELPEEDEATRKPSGASDHATVHDVP